MSSLKSDKFKNKLDFSRLPLAATNSAVLADNSTVESYATQMMGSAFYTDSPCLYYLRVLTRQWKDNNKKRVEYISRQREKAARRTVPPFKPSGKYVASLHDHTAAVNEIGKLPFCSHVAMIKRLVVVVAVSPTNSLFASCSNDGTVRIWNPYKWEVNHQDPLGCTGAVNLKKGRVRNLSFLSSDKLAATLSDAIQIIDVDSMTSGNNRELFCALLKIESEVLTIELNRFSFLESRSVPCSWK